MQINLEDHFPLPENIDEAIVRQSLGVSERSVTAATFDSIKYKLQPAPGRLAIKVEDIERQTKSGLLLLSDSHMPKPTVGTVVAVTEQYEQDGEEFGSLYKIGDTVVFGKYTGSTVQVGTEKYIIMRENDILARLIPSDAPEAITREKVRINDRNDE